MGNLVKDVRAGLILIALHLLLVEPAAADSARYLPATAVDLTQLLPEPPAAGSALAQQDMDAVLAAQSARTPESMAAAEADAVVSVFRFADVLGPGFTGDRLPLTAALFKAVGQDATKIGRRAKDFWHRTRPYRANDSIKPLVDVSTDGSYPSGHAMFGCMTAVLLGAMVPEQRAALLARGQTYAHNRVVAGVHYPTDVEAGCTSGKVIAAVLLQAPGFQSDFVAARSETRRVLGLPATASKPD
jgi:acid phosphatase (class A)